MYNLKCVVFDKDKFIAELLKSFVEKTEGIEMTGDMEEADVVFVDASLYDGDYTQGLNSSSQIVIISSNKVFLKALFNNKISDFLIKSEINYGKFLRSLGKLKGNSSVLRQAS